MRATAHADLIVKMLGRFWQQPPSPPELSVEQLSEVAEPLIKTGAGAIGWWRIRSSTLQNSDAALQLYKAYRFHTLLSTFYRHKIKEAFKCFRSAGIEPVLVKGWAIARLYPEPGLRPYTDIDLCVRPRDYANALATQKSLEDREFWIDIHRGFSKLDALSEDELYARSQLVRVDDVDVRILCPEDHLRVLCVHLLRHGALRPLWLCDIAVALESRAADFDWDRCLGDDRRHADWVACTVALAHLVLGVPIDDTPVAKRATNLPRWLVPSLLRQWDAPYPPDRYHAPMEIYLRHPKGLLNGLRKRWPNPIEATSSVNGPFNEWPRFPFQVGNCILRATKYFAELSKITAKK